ncbi:MAG: sulfatase [Actinomycetota bacterium]
MNEPSGSCSSLRKRALGGFAALLLVSTSLGIALAKDEATVKKAAAARPNVLIVLLDDMRDQGTLDVMPETRRIFQDGGVVYANAFDSTPLCCPARGSLWSGQYSHNHGVLTNKDPAAESRYDQTKTLQYYLSQAGYMNALVGKYWNDWPRTTPPPYFQKFTMMAGGYNNATFNVDGVQKQLPGYSTDVMGNVSVGYLQSFEANDAQPWFLYIATHAPHENYTPSSKYANAAVPAWQRNASVLETDLSDKPQPVRTVAKPLDEVERIRAQQLRTLMSVDDVVSKVFAEMDRLGEQDTLALFLSDNGFFWGEHGGLTDKRMPYTEDVSIPLLARWPGHIAPGTVESKMVAQIDIEPTILSTLGITPSHVIDGASLFGTGARQYMFLEYTRSTDIPAVRSWAAILTPAYEYAEWFNDDGSLYFREYYNLVNDPLQLTNLYADGVAGNDPPIGPLNAQLTHDRTCAGTTCPQPATSSSIFADDFSGGLGQWSGVSGITIASNAGGVVPPSALASSTGSRVNAFRAFGAGYASACVSFNARVNSIGSTSVALMHLETASSGGIGRVSMSPARVLFIRADLTGATRYSLGALPLGTWNAIELCGTTGTSGTWSLYLNGSRIVGPWTANNGTVPFGGVGISQNVGKTYSVNFDDVVVDDHVG